MAGNPPGWTVDRVTSLKFIGFAGALVLSLIITTLFGFGFAPMLAFCVIAAVVGYMAPNMYLYQIGYDRTQKMQKAMPDALDLLTISVESGLGFDAALSHVARNTEGPLAEEFARVLQEMQIGLGRGAALRALGERTHVPELKGFVSAMVQADALGIPIAQVLRVQAREIRIKRRQRAEEQAQKVAVKILVPLIFCILPCLFIAVLGPAAIGIMEVLLGPPVTRFERLELASRVFCVAAIFGLSLALFDALALRGTILLAAISGDAMAADLSSRLPERWVAVAEGALASLVIGVALPEGVPCCPTWSFPR